jgi:hypothetical protein
MILSPASERPPAPPSRPRAGSTAHRDAVACDALSALLEALNAPDRYRLIQHHGEIFIEPAN